MIEEVLCPDGSCTIRFQGRLLASRFAPQQEAVLWVKKRLEFLNQVKTIFILGAGSGYHIGEILAQSAAQVVVIEPAAELIDLVQVIHNFDSKRVRFENLKSITDLRSCESIRAAISESFVCLVHSPSRQGRESLFDELRSQLVGRDWGALTWQWRLQGLGELDPVPRVGSEKLTIYDLEQTELVSNGEEREALLIKALRELVK